MSTSRTAELVKTVAAFLSKTKCYDKVLQEVKIISGGDGKCLAELQVGPEHLNALGGLHGGFTATLVDSISTWALMTKEEVAYGGVSVDIHMSYLKGAKEGEIILIDAQTLKAGRNLAFLEVEIRNKEKGHIIAKGSHTKFIGQS